MTTNNSHQIRFSSHRLSTNPAHDNKQLISFYPFHHQYHNMSMLTSDKIQGQSLHPHIPMTRNSSSRRHSSYHRPLLPHYRGNFSHLPACSKNIHIYEDTLNKQSLHTSLNHKSSLINLQTPMLTAGKRHHSITILRSIEDVTKIKENEDENEIKKKNWCKKLYKDVCRLVNVFRILPFLLFCLCVTMITIFYDATWTFVVDYMKRSNLTAEKGSHIIFGAGLIAIFGEIGFGYMGDSKK